MIGMIVLGHLGYAVGAVALAAIVGGVLGYAFRGKENRALANLGNDIKKKL